MRKYNSRLKTEKRKKQNFDYYFHHNYDEF